MGPARAPFSFWRFDSRRPETHACVECSEHPMAERFGKAALWTLIALTGATGFAMTALGRGETVNAVWVLAAALGSFALAYVFYARYIVERALGVDPARTTPAVRHDDGFDYVPTHRVVLFGHHFA